MAAIDVDVLARYIGRHEKREAHDVVPMQMGHEDMEVAGLAAQAAQRIVAGQSRAGTHVQQYDVIAGRAQFHARRISAVGAADAKRQAVYKALRFFQAVEVEACARNQSGRQLRAQLRHAKRRGKGATSAPEVDADALAIVG